MQIGDRTGVERTLNICCMVVTLEVSKLSGWLNADALCRESRGGHAVRGRRGCGPADGGDGVQSAVEARCRLGIEQAWSARSSGSCS